MRLRLYFIRHGETEWSLSSQHTGSTEIPLTPRGEDEARELGYHLKGIPFSQVLTSPRLRARRTCELAGLGVLAEREPDLAEWDYGDYEGRTSVDIQKEREGWNLFEDGCPHGEMPGQVTTRVDRLIALLLQCEGNIALFSHGQIGCVFAARWIELPLVEAQHFTLGTASLSILSHDLHHPEVPVIALWNAFAPSASTAMSLRQRALDRWENEGGEIPKP